MTGSAVAAKAVLLSLLRVCINLWDEIGCAAGFTAARAPPGAAVYGPAEVADGPVCGVGTGGAALLGLLFVLGGGALFIFTAKNEALSSDDRSALMTVTVLSEWMEGFVQGGVCQTMIFGSLL